MERRFIVVALALGWLGTTPAHAAPDPQALKWIPSDAIGLISVDFSALRGSEHFSGAVELANSQGESGPVDTAPGAGLHPKTHVDRTTAGVLLDGQRFYVLTGATLAEAATRKAYAPPTTAEPATTATPESESKPKSKPKPTPKSKSESTPTTAAGAEAVRYLGHESFPVHDGNWALFVGEHTALVATPRSLKRWVKNLTGKSVVIGKHSGWNARLTAVDQKPPIWFTSGPARADLAPPSGAPGAEAVHGKAELKKGLTVHVQVDCKTEKACADLASRINRHLDRARQQLALRLLGIGALADRIQVQAKGARATLDATLSRNQVKMALKVGPRIARMLR